MRDKIARVAFLLFSLLMAFLAVLLKVDNAKLHDQVTERNSLIEASRISDSLYSESNKRYVDTITKYVSGCNIMIDGRSVSTAELIRYMNKLIDDNYLLKDSLIIERDSLHVYKKFLRFIQDSYKTDARMEYDGTKVHFKTALSTADSALALFPFYKDRIKVNDNGHFFIDVMEKR